MTDGSWGARWAGGRTAGRADPGPFSFIVTSLRACVREYAKHICRRRARTMRSQRAYVYLNFQPAVMSSTSDRRSHRPGPWSRIELADTLTAHPLTNTDQKTHTRPLEICAHVSARIQFRLGRRRRRSHHRRLYPRRLRRSRVNDVCAHMNNDWRCRTGCGRRPGRGRRVRAASAAHATLEFERCLSCVFVGGVVRLLFRLHGVLVMRRGINRRTHSRAL